MATPATGDDSLQQLWLGKELPDGVASAILVPTSSELLLRNLIQAAERLGITYSVDRAKKENQLLIKPEVIDLTEEPELPDRPAEAAPQPPQEQSLPSQVNRPIGNFGWQSNQFRTLPFLLNKNFNYAGNLPYSFPMTGTGIPNMMPSYRELPPMGIAPGLPFFSCNQNANGEFRMNSDPGARLSVHFADEVGCS
ncbi:unnamed protein product [Heligmosomoides polygyrus]|uniref:Anti_prolifrtn domain-containing protein n=1 Tax=Heligmosomoides polygyrus TaxID=6339 RepID=A0A183G283_HELPZ|nr:unnamed protein product [Heligmosomoides polygyrus]